MRTSLAVKIFLSFWLIHAVIFVVLAFVPDKGRDARRLDQLRRDAQVAVAFLEEEGPDACAAFLARAERHTGTHATLYAQGSGRACGTRTATPASDADILGKATEQGVVLSAGGEQLAAVTVAGRRAPYTLVGTVRPAGGRRDQPPFPYGFLVLAMLVSGLVCFVLARSLASPLQRMRAATHRLKEGDLSARAGEGFRGRADEIGDVVRDFDGMAERIESLMRAQQQLLSDISHELRSPLARLNVALELARRAPAGASSHLDRIEREAERMNELIGRLLALARAESRAVEGHAEEFDLEEVVRRVTDDAQYEAHKSGKRVSLSTEGKAMLRGDPLLVASAIENVVRNAIRYTPPDSTVEVEASVSGGRARITVRDHGGGVPDPELERVFLPFHRVDASRDRDSGGTGLGLSIAQRAVVSQGGTITAANTSGGGLAVTITLPVTLR